MSAVLILYINITFCVLFLKQKCLTLEKLIDELNIFKILIEKEMRTTPMIRKTYEIKIRTCQKDLKMAVKDVDGKKKKNTFMLPIRYNYSCKVFFSIKKDNEIIDYLSRNDNYLLSLFTSFSSSIISFMFYSFTLFVGRGNIKIQRV